MSTRILHEAISMNVDSTSSEDIMLWPDGTQCTRESLEDFLTFMSDDYEVIRFGTPRWHELAEE